jgi:hypothetical protein
LILRIWSPEAPKSVRADGNSLEPRTNRTDWEKADRAWWFDAEDQRVWVRLKDAGDARVDLEN